MDLESALTCKSLIFWELLADWVLVNMNRKILILWSLFIICQSCLNRQEADKDVAPSTPNHGEKFLVNLQGDTIPTGIPILVKENEVDPDSVASPVKTRLKRPPVRELASKNIIQLQGLRSVKIPDELQVFIPGENGINIPKAISASSKKVPSRQPPSQPAMPLSFSDAASYDIRHIDVEQGLSSSFVWDILEDRNGHLWFGTGTNGIIRYNGHDLTNYTTEEGLSHNTLRAMMEDSQGNLWFATDGGGLCRYDGAQFVHFTKEEGLSNNVVYSLLEDNRGMIWIGTRNGLNRFDGRSFTHFTSNEGLSGNIIGVMHEDRQGLIWIGCFGSGVTQLNPMAANGRGRFIHFTTNEGLGDNWVRDIYEDKDGILWFATGRGISFFDGVRFTQITEDDGLSHNEVWSICQDSQGDFWFGTRYGLNKYERDPQVDKITQITVDQGLNNNWITCIQEDRQGNLWLGTRGGGVNRFDTRGFTYMQWKSGLDQKWITSIVEDQKGSIWFGSHNGGLTRYDGTYFHHFTTEHGLHSNEISSLQKDDFGNIWIGMYGGGGVDCFDGGSFTHFGKAQGLFSPNIWAMLHDSRGHLWFGTWFGGASRYSPDQGRNAFAHFSMQQGLGSNDVLGFMEDGSGNIWLGTRGGGVGIFDGKYLTNLNPKEGLGSHAVASMMEDSQGYLWFGGKGLSRYDPKNEWGHFITFTEEDGLCDNIITSILEDRERNIWVSSPSGISMLRPVGNDIEKTDRIRYDILTFEVGDGLKKINLSQGGSCVDQNNRIWWGSVNGLTMLDLNHFVVPRDTPEVLLRTIEVNEEFVDYRRLVDSSYRNQLSYGKSLVTAIDSVVSFQNYPLSLSLPARINHLTFHFYAIDFAAPHKLRYSFMIDGLDDSWSTPRAEGKADYRSLPHGNYVFKVKAMGESKVWSKPFTYRFEIMPFWWQTTWANALYGVLLLGGLWAIHRYEISRRQLRHQLELEHVRAEKLEEINQIKSRFFANISHEFRTPLTLLLGPVKELIDRGKKADLPYLKLIERNSHRLLNLINQLLDLSKLEANEMKLRASQQDLVPFLRQLFAAFCSTAEQKNIEYIFHADTDSVPLYFDPEKLEKVVLNLQSNAFKFTPEGGKVSLDLKSSEESIEIIISDTGPGIPTHQLPKIFDRFFQIEQRDNRSREGAGIGLALVKELVQLHRGEINVESQPGSGTSFKVKLRRGKAHLQPDEITVSQDPPALDVTITGSLVQTQPVSIEEDQMALDLPLVLIAEDNADMRLFIRRSLESHFRVVEAADGKTGLEFALQHVPDLIISDVMMPILDGLELCGRLKSDARTSHIPIIMLTAKADFDTRIEGLKRGADVYLAKPFDKKELLVRMEKLLQLREELRTRYQRMDHLAPTGDPAIEIEDDFIRRLEILIEDNLGDYDFGINQICQAMRMSRSQVYRKLKVLTGKSVNQFIRTHRLRKARYLLQTSDFNVSEVAYEVGFKDPAYFSRSFSNEFGVSPSELI